MEQTALFLKDTAQAVVAKSSRTCFKIPAENLAALRDRIDELNKRVSRLAKRGYDVAAVQIQVGDLYVEKRRKGTVERESGYANVELLSPKPPRVDGWEFVAALSHVEDVGAVLRVCPGVVVAEGELRKYREASAKNCDHCQVVRRRTDTFVIRDRGGELRQVGRQCLAAYTGLANPEILCAQAEILFSVSDVLFSAEDEDFEGGGGRGHEYASIASYLPFVACSIRVDGWLARGTARQTMGNTDRSTANLAWSKGLFPPRGADVKDVYQPEEKDYNLASATIEFCEAHFASCNVDGLTDYENSLRVAMASGILYPKFDGLVASAINYYKRDIERRAKSEVWAEMVRNSRPQGVVGERGVFEGLRILACRTWQTEYGATHFYSLLDEGGNAFVYFATRDLNLEPGQVVSFKATVKKHATHTPKFAGAPTYAQTTLTRCALVARARLVAHEVGERLSDKLVVTNPDRLPGIYAEYERPMEKVNLYHLVGLDGRKFLYTSKSKKKAMVEGVTAIVEYDAEDFSKANGGERPVSIVAVLT
jgi:hypothetical protein